MEVIAFNYTHQFLDILPFIKVELSSSPLEQQLDLVTHFFFFIFLIDLRKREKH